MTFAEIEGLPKYSAIEPDQIQQTISALIEENRREIQIILDNVGATPTWENLIQPLEELDDRLTKAWVPVSHMNAVVSTPELRGAHDACIAELSQYSTELGQSQPLYQAYRKIADGDAFAALGPAQQKVITDAVLGFELSGVGLPDEEKKRFAEISRASSPITFSMPPMPGPSTSRMSRISRACPRSTSRWRKPRQRTATSMVTC